MIEKKSLLILPVLAALAILIFSGCSRTIGLLVGPSATPSATPSPTLTPTPAPTLTPTVTPTLPPTPTPIPQVQIASADRALFNGDWDTAIQEYQSVLKNAGADGVEATSSLTTAALLGLGHTYYQAGSYSLALNVLRDLIDKFPDAPQRAPAFFFMGEAYNALTRYSEAADAYQSYLALRPGVIDSYVFELRGDAEFNDNNFAGALADYKAALQNQRASQAIPLQIKLARTTSITGDYATAQIMYQDIYDRAPDDYTKAQVDYLRGQAYAANNELEQASNAYLDAVQNYPLAYDSYLSLVALVEQGYPVNELDRGLVDYFAGQYQVALAAFDRYLQSDPVEPATAIYYKGLALADLGNYEAAISQWDVIIQSYNSSDFWDNAWEMKAYYQWSQLDKYDIATQTLTDFVSMAPNDPRAAEFLFDAARVAERANNLDTAALLWNRVGLEYPSSNYAFRSLFLAGVSQYRMAEYPKAQAAFERLLGTATNITDKSQALFWMAKSQEASGDKIDAKATWEQTVATDPTGYYSERARDILAGKAPLTPPDLYELNVDKTAERAEAETWLRKTFVIPAEVDLSGAGPLANDPRLIRGTELWHLGLESQARDEFENLRTAVADDSISTYCLANYLADLGVYRSAIMAARQVLTLAGMDDAATLNAPIYFNHLRFGIYFSDLVIPTAQAYNFNPLLLFSVIRQESMFESFSNSSAAARGLMQIIPTTGQSIADRAGWPPNYTADDLYRPKVSITFGADYLDTQRHYLNDDLYAALAAYNGGPGNASEWQGLANGDPDLFVEIVRFDETRRYLTNIYEIFSIYRQLYSLAQ